ncbi:MAG TPA: TonB-dependent receptor [Pyrinomonadaceae bacterium]|nr:TonB-dependent receptor [Pyrinomonadaceae bacterium]
MRFCLCFIALLYSLNVSPIAAQSTGARITGTVHDPLGQVIVDARVEMLNIGSGVILKSSSNSDGVYELGQLPLGSYMLSINSPGFAVATRSITLRRNESYLEDFSLVPGIIESSITVTAGKGSARVAADAPQMVTVTDQSDFERRRPASTTRALELTPNLITINANPALERPRLRGLASNRLLIVLDGERLNNVRSDPTSGVSPSIVDVAQLKVAEVLSGAGSSLYGSDAMAGVINLITPSEERGDNYLDLRFNGDFRTNGRFRRGVAAINWNTWRYAVRLSGSLFRESAYHTGDEEIPLSDVVRLGNLATAMGNEAGNNVARTYAVWSLPAGGEVANSQGHGFNDQVDFWFYPSWKQSIRYRQLNSQHKDLGFSFIAPPFDPRRQFNSFRRLDKYGLRYEGRDLVKWLPRVAASFYGQKYSFPDDTLTSQILFNSSWTLGFEPGQLGFFSGRLTGNPSSFAGVNLSENKNSITTHGLDLQATFAPFVGGLVTTGVGYLRDSSVDEFSRTDLVAPFNVVSGRASNPDTDYTNWSWFNLLEHEPFRWLRLNGGLRVDNWSTQAKVTRGFPLGIESVLLDRSFNFLLAVPGQVSTTGAAGLLDLVNGVNGISTSRTVVTGTAGAVVRLPQGINPYFRWGTSYREPGITERYLLRNFGDPSFSVLVIPNTTLRPERGREFDFGVKVQRAKWNVSVNYFRNDLKDFIGNTSAGPYIIPIDPALGLGPISLEFPFHGVLYVQRVNTARARIQGLETQYDVNLGLDRGVISAFGSTGWMKGTNLTPDEVTLRLLSRFYNRSDTPVELSGSPSDAPLSSITPLRTINGLRFDSLDRRWFAEYELRYQAQVKRADPLDLSAPVSTEYGTFRSLSSFTVQSLRGGYTVRGERHKIMFTVGLENLTNRLYFEHFQTAPAPGRSVVFGTTVELMNLLNSLFPRRN